MFYLEALLDTKASATCYISPFEVFEVFEIFEGYCSDGSFMKINIIGPVTFIILNKKHPFYKRIYLKNKENGDICLQETIELLLLSHAKKLKREMN